MPLYTAEQIMTVLDMDGERCSALLRFAENIGCLNKTDDLFGFSINPQIGPLRRLTCGELMAPLHRFFLLLPKDRQKDDLRRALDCLVGENIVSGEEAARFLVEFGGIMEKSKNVEDALSIYHLGALFGKFHDVARIYNLKFVLGISRLEFMRGISPIGTLLLQQEILLTIDDHDTVAEDALLMIYTGMWKHFIGYFNEGHLLRKNGIKQLEQFGDTQIANEAIPLVGWHHYLTGNFEEAVNYYEMTLLALEGNPDTDINIFSYPPIIFSYIFIGEYKHALVLNERLYRRAVETKDWVAVSMMNSISGRIYTYMGDQEKAKSVLYNNYSKSIQIDYGWGQYYTLFGICLLHIKNNNPRGCREAMELAVSVTEKYGLGFIYASPLYLDALRMIEENGLPCVKGLHYREQLCLQFQSYNIHLVGVACRHLAQIAEDEEHDMTKAVTLLERSVDLLKTSGSRLELGCSYVALAKIHLKTDDKKSACEYADRAYVTLREHTIEYFPNELRNYISNDTDPVDFGIMLETSWLECQHIVNVEQLTVKILTFLGRLLKMESGALLRISRLGVVSTIVSQNIERTVNSAQFQRINKIVSLVAEKNEIYMNLSDSAHLGKTGIDLNESPRFIFCIPFCHEKKSDVVLYLESYYKDCILTETELSALSDYVCRISRKLIPMLDYKRTESAESGAISAGPTGHTATGDYYRDWIDESTNMLVRQIDKIAGANVPILLTGETGVGKEIFANEVFRKSANKSKFIKINCGTIPESLIESELFGYEKGSFTGASHRKRGYFESAEDGTVFLDEIGELTLSGQVKLLRILQEGEIIRVGGTESIKVNCRIIAATNKNLHHEVCKGTFREDLFYRLNIFQFEIPPLRKRKTDILRLTQFFLDKYSRKLNKPALIVPQETVARMLEYSWPGNVRELENMIYREMLLNENNVLTFPALTQASAIANGEESDVQEFYGVLQAAPQEKAAPRYQPLQAVETAHMIKVLNHCNWKISGPGGAAEILGIKRTTLLARMKRYGIHRSSEIDRT
jgi:transcriptional regulator with GAF, ATPase, and Fis domain